MKNVTRPAKPASLQRNAEQWTRNLLAAQRRQTDSKRLRTLVDRYKRPDVREALDKMYAGLCCYCEAEIGSWLLIISSTETEGSLPEKLLRLEQPAPRMPQV